MHTSASTQAYTSESYTWLECVYSKVSKELLHARNGSHYWLLEQPKEKNHMFKKAVDLTMKPCAFSNNLCIIRKSIFSAFIWRLDRWNRLRERGVTWFSKLHVVWAKNIHVNIHKHKYALQCLLIAFICSLHICISFLSTHFSLIKSRCQPSSIAVPTLLYKRRVGTFRTALNNSLLRNQNL